MKSVAILIIDFFLCKKINDIKETNKQLLDCENNIDYKTSNLKGKITNEAE